MRLDVVDTSRVSQMVRLMHCGRRVLRMVLGFGLNLHSGNGSGVVLFLVGPLMILLMILSGRT